MTKHLINWLVMTVAVFIAAYILPGIYVENWLVAFVTSVVLAIINMFLKPILVILTLPINILSLGLFTLIINAFLVMLTARIVDGFIVNGLWQAMLFSLILSAISFVLHVAENDK